MTLTNEPPIITQLSTQLAACAAWPAGATTWYPTKPNATSPPFVLLVERSRRVRPYAAGAAGIPGGVLEVDLAVSDTIGNAESLARTLLEQLLAQTSGIPFLEADCGVSAEPTPGEIAGGTSITTITMTLPWGLAV
jgi:hypothetical protein